MIKLFNRSLRPLLIYAAVVTVASIPVYYLLVEYIWRSELKEHNRIVSDGVKQNILHSRLSGNELDSVMRSLSKIQPGVLCAPATEVRADSVYDVYRQNLNSAQKETDRFQGLVSYFEINGRAYSVTVETNMEEANETIAALTVAGLVFFIVLLGGFLFINRRVSGNIWRPFYDTLEKMKGFDLSRQEPIVFEKTNISEFHELNDSLSKLIAVDLEVYKKQKEFTENVSHELQTPLAVAQTKLDILLQGNLVDEQYVLIDEAQKALNRITRINRNLLLLAKIGNSQFPDAEPVNVSLLLEQALSGLTDIANGYNLIIVPEISANCHVTANKILTGILLENLLTNAIRYSSQGSTIKAELTPSGLTVTNPGTAALDKTGLFKRFGKASENPGTGLGLALVQQISDRYGWTTGYRFEDGCHHFSVHF